MPARLSKDEQNLPAVSVDEAAPIFVDFFWHCLHASQTHGPRNGAPTPAQLEDEAQSKSTATKHCYLRPACAAKLYGALDVCGVGASIIETSKSKRDGKLDILFDSWSIKNTKEGPPQTKTHRY